MWKSKVVSFWTPVHLNDWNRNSWNSCSLWPQQGRYLGGGQLSGSPAAAAAERVDSSGHGPAARLKVDGGRLQWLRARHRLLSVNVCGYHGNGSLGRHHGDGDALTGRLDERQRLSRPNRTASDRQLLQRDRRETDRWDRQITAREGEWDGDASVCVWGPQSVCTLSKPHTPPETTFPCCMKMLQTKPWLRLKSCVQSVLLPLRLHQSGHSLKHLQARSHDTQYLYTLWM